MIQIHNIAEIDRSTPEGMLLICALELLSAESLVAKTAEEYLKECRELAEHMYSKLDQPAY